MTEFSIYTEFWLINLLFAIPAFAAYDITTSDRPLYEVLTTVEIDADTATVWKNVVTFPELAPPTETIFRAGMESRYGEFRLRALAEGKTLLEGRTWYQQGLYPQAYWKLFSDEIIHTIHQRVLNHIKQVSEMPNTTN